MSKRKRYNKSKSDSDDSLINTDEEKYILEEYIHLPLFLGETITAL